MGLIPHLLLLLPLLLLLLFAGTAVCALCRLWRGERDDRWLRSRRAGFCDTADGPGVSLLVSGLRSTEEAERLLQTEYARCEVIAVVDGAACPGLLRELTDTYRLVRMDYIPSPELPTFGVRGLYRSRRRCFRRMVVLDRSASLPADDWDAAAGVASCDWLLPLQPDVDLLPEGLGRFVDAVERTPAEAQLTLVGTTVGPRLVLVRAEETVASGGFCPRLVQGIHRSRRRWLQVPVAVRREGPAERGRHVLRGALAAGAALALLSLVPLVLALSRGRPPLLGPHLSLLHLALALLGTLLLAGCVAVCAAPLVAPRQPPGRALAESLRWLFGKFAVKNFTVS